jgi:hypothetical protein
MIIDRVIRNRFESMLLMIFFVSFDCQMKNHHDKILSIISCQKFNFTIFSLCLGLELISCELIVGKSELNIKRFMCEYYIKKKVIR